MPDKPVIKHIYLHFPFCVAKCYYCSFYSVPYQVMLAQKYLSYLEKEIEQAQNDYDLSQLNTIYIGGGTPNLDINILKNIDQLLTLTFNLDSIIEYTIECNTSLLNEQLLKFLNESKCNRLSLGIQSLNPHVLEICRRKSPDIPYFEQFLKNISEEQSISISCDFINGLPGQDNRADLVSIKDFIESFPCINHISLYDLTIEPGCYFYKHKPAVFSQPDKLNDFEYILAAILKKNNFLKYEVSNYARPGYESIHNQAYWHYANYLGLGPAAHSTINNLRIENFPDLSLYLSGKDYQSKTILTKLEQIKEYLLMGLRLYKGINLNDFKHRFNFDLQKLIPQVIAKYSEMKYVIFDSSNIRITVQGMNYLNTILVDIFLEIENNWIF